MKSPDGEAQMATPDRSCHQPALSGRQARRSRSAFTGSFGISLIVLGRIIQRGEVMRDRILEFHQRVLHARRGRDLRDPRLMASDAEQLGDATFVIAGERKGIWSRGHSGRVRLPCT